jgi:hypothetical protein
MFQTDQVDCGDANTGKPRAKRKTRPIGIKSQFDWASQYWDQWQAPMSSCCGLILILIWFITHPFHYESDIQVDAKPYITFWQAEVRNHV